MSTNQNPYNVKAGQCWREVDPRVKRRIYVLEILKGGKALIQTDGETRRKTTANLSRFHGKRGGYALETM